MINPKDFLKKSLLYRLYAFPAAKLEKESKLFLGGVCPKQSDKAKQKAKWSYILFDLPFHVFFQCRCYKFSLFKARWIVSYSKGQKPLYKTINSSVAHDVLCDKWKSYQLFRDYYRRDIEFVSHGEIISNTALDKVQFFANVHKEFIVKPLGKNCGKGIQIINNAPKLNTFWQLLTRCMWMAL